MPPYDNLNGLKTRYTRSSSHIKGTGSMNAGTAQELRLATYVKSQGYTDIHHGEATVKTRLGLPAGPGCKCADLLGLAPGGTLPKRLIVAESKGTEVAKAIKQLGNAAAAALEAFGSSIQKLELLLYRSELRALPIGLSPGPGYLVSNGNSIHDFVLIDATSSVQKPARAICDLGPPWNRWSAKLQTYTIHVYVERV